jgi:hypothetical protein
MRMMPSRATQIVECQRRLARRLLVVDDRARDGLDPDRVVGLVTENPSYHVGGTTRAAIKRRLARCPSQCSQAPANTVVPPVLEGIVDESVRHRRRVRRTAFSAVGFRLISDIPVLRAREGPRPRSLLTPPRRTRARALEDGPDIGHVPVWPWLTLRRLCVPSDRDHLRAPCPAARGPDRDWKSYVVVMGSSGTAAE